jgi:hypothetical protein
MKPKQDRSLKSTTVQQFLFGSFFQQHPVTYLSFSGDSNSLAVSCGSEVILCESVGWLPTRDPMVDTVVERLHIEGDKLVHQALYSPNSSMLAVMTAFDADGSGSRVLLYSRSPVWQLQDSLSFSNEGENESVLAHLLTR